MRCRDAVALCGATVFAVCVCGAAAHAANAPDPAAAPRGLIQEPAPRPQTAIRVQPRFAVKAHLFQLFAGAEYLSRGDFYNSPGAHIGAAYYVLEPLALEAQVSHYWSSLDAEAERVKETLGAIPDSHPPGWLALVGARYSIGYGKLMVGGLGGVIHFEPQTFVHAGVHDHGGDVGPSADAGLGFLVFLTARLFTRIDAALVFERESRSGQTVSVWGTLPSLSLGGTL
jgi:outer membrane beta-barrel protein